MDGNIFTQSRLRAIKANDDAFFNNERYQNEFCLLIGPTCAAPRSVMRFFDGTFAAVDSVFDDPDFENINAVMFAASTNPATVMLLENVMPIDYTITATEARASIVRSSFTFAWPLEGHSHVDDDEDAQQKKLAGYLNDYISDAQKLYKDGVADMDFYYFSGTIFGEYVTAQVFADMGLLGGSLLFIFFFMWLQTRSLFVTGFALLSIVTSFFIANMVYRVVCDYRYFGVFHVLGLFIILGIGADDVFVFYDTWRESGHYKFPSMAHRLSFAYRRASLAMMWTSASTAVAFIVSATSPFLGVSSFGVFSGILVFVNYMSVITFFPCVVIMHHIYFEKFRCCCCCPHRDAPSLEGSTHAMDREEKNLIVRFFHGPYYHAITNSVFRWVIVAIMAAFLIFFIYQATTLKVNEEQVGGANKITFDYIK